jgi:RND family efflux transporter MFP subunit
MKNKIIKLLEKPKIIMPVLIILSVIAGIFAYMFVGHAPKVTLDYKDSSDPSLSLQNFKDGETISLAFPKSGRISNVYVKAGDAVTKGQMLAQLSSEDAKGAVNQANATLDIAKANYEKILNGATGTDIDILKVAVVKATNNLENTKATQATLVSNAYDSMLNSSVEAIPKNGTSDYVAPIISGNYSLGKEGVINLTSYYSVGGTSFTTTGLTNGSGISNTIIAQPIGDSGLYIKFPNSTSINVNDWIINIPNKKAANYLANYNAYQNALKGEQSALSSAQSAIDQRTAELAIKKSTARGSDIDLANANILSADGQVQAALSRYNDTVISAPADGTITSIDIKIGELAMAQKSAIILQDVSNIYIETNINEANIANLTIGMPIDITYDSFGGDKIFKGNITKIDPASTLVSGVVNYKITASTEQLPELRPGMTANMTINVKEKNGVIAIPSRSIITDDKGNRTLRVITNTKNKKWKSVPIVTGIEGDGGLVEVISGLSVGDEYVILIKP